MHLFNLPMFFSSLRVAFGTLLPKALHREVHSTRLVLLVGTNGYNLETKAALFSPLLYNVYNVASDRSMGDRLFDTRLIS